MFQEIILTKMSGLRGEAKSKVIKDLEMCLLEFVIIILDINESNSCQIILGCVYVGAAIEAAENYISLLCL